MFIISNYSRIRLGLYDEVVLVERSSGGVNYYPNEGEANESAWVVGVARHRLWLRSSRSGRLCGYTRDSLWQLLNSGLLRVRCKHAMDESSPFDFTDIIPDVDSAGAMKELMVDSWTGELDRVLVSRLNEFAAHLGYNPLLLSYHQLTDFALTTHTHIDGLAASDILLRVILLLLFNDTVTPLLPFLSYLPAKEDNTSSERASLEVLRRCLLIDVKRDVMVATSLVNVSNCTGGSNVFKSCFPTISFSPKLPEIAPYASSGSSLSLSPDDSGRVFYVRSEDSVIDCILQDASTKGTKEILFENRG